MGTIQKTQFDQLILCVVTYTRTLFYKTNEFKNEKSNALNYLRSVYVYIQCTWVKIVLAKNQSIVVLYALVAKRKY